jgi:rubrerythrin
VPEDSRGVFTKYSARHYFPGHSLPTHARACSGLTPRNLARISYGLQEALPETMGCRLLPHTLPELYAHALVLEREATRRFELLARCMRDAGVDHIAEEFEAIGKEEREQYELIAAGTASANLVEPEPWEYAWQFMGPGAEVVRQPKSTRDVIQLAIAAERRTQNFYADVAEHVDDDAVSAFSAEMAADEGRHIERLERLLAREPHPAMIDEDAGTAFIPAR